MDLQGKPIPQGPHSSKVQHTLNYILLPRLIRPKVTNDPDASRNPINEPSGPVPNDSLAAESATKGGTFAENRGSQPLGATAGQAATNTTNTSGTTELPPAPVGGLREDRERKEMYPEALGGQGDYPGPHVPESGYVGGPTAAKQDLGIGQDQQGRS
jgi:hypothetical protein